MSVPPFNRSSGNTKPNSDNEPHEVQGNNGQKKFSLPQTKSRQNNGQKNNQLKAEEEREEAQGIFGLAKKGKGDEKEEKKKQSKQDEDAQLQISEQVKIGIEQSLELPSGQVQKVDVTKISEIILRMVDKMATAEIGKSQLTSLELKESNVPQAFLGSTITLLQSDEGMVIKFDNFQSPQQEAIAMMTIKNNPQALEQLMRSLGNKDISVSQIQVGQNNIALPRLDTPLAFQSPSSESEKRRDDQSQDDQRQQQKEQQPEEDTE